MPKNSSSNLYNDVIGHQIYEALTADLDEKQRAEVDRTVQEFTRLLESGLLKPCMDLVEMSRTEVATEMAEDAIKKAQAAAGDDTKVPASEGKADLTEDEE